MSMVSSSPKEAAAEAEPERGRDFGFECSGESVELQLLQSVAELFVVVRADRNRPANTRGLIA